MSYAASLPGWLVAKTSEENKVSTKNLDMWLHDVNAKFVKQLGEAMEKIDVNTERIIKLEKENEALKKENDALKISSNTNESVDFWNKFDKEVAYKVTKVVEKENVEIKRREKNLIIFGLNKIEEEPKDKEQVVELLKSIYNEVPIEKVIIKRFKVKDSSKAAPILLEFENVNVRNEVLKNNKKLRASEKFGKVYINTDQTPSELIANKIFREDIKKRNASLGHEDSKGRKYGMNEAKENETPTKFYWGIRKNELVKVTVKEDQQFTKNDYISIFYLLISFFLIVIIIFLSFIKENRNRGNEGENSDIEETKSNEQDALLLYDLFTQDFETIQHEPNENRILNNSLDNSFDNMFLLYNIDNINKDGSSNSNYNHTSDSLKTSKTNKNLNMVTITLKGLIKKIKKKMKRKKYRKNKKRKNKKLKINENRTEKNSNVIEKDKTQNIEVQEMEIDNLFERTNDLTRNENEYNRNSHLKFWYTNATSLKRKMNEIRSICLTKNINILMIFTFTKNIKYFVFIGKNI